MPAKRHPELEGDGGIHVPPPPTVEAGAADRPSGALGQVHAVHAYSSTIPWMMLPNPAATSPTSAAAACWMWAATPISSLAFAGEPSRALSLSWVLEPHFKTDRIASGIMEFARASPRLPAPRSYPTSSRWNILGTDGRLEIGLPFNTHRPPHLSTQRLHRQRETNSRAGGLRPVHNQADCSPKPSWTIHRVPTPLEDAIG